MSFDASEAAFGHYHGTGSRCIDESEQFARLGHAPRAGGRRSAACYRMECQGAADARHLFVMFDGAGVSVRCPSGASVDLSSVPGAHPTCAAVEM